MIPVVVDPFYSIVGGFAMGPLVGSSKKQINPVRGISAQRPVDITGIDNLKKFMFLSLNQYAGGSRRCIGVLKGIIGSNGLPPRLQGFPGVPPLLPGSTGVRRRLGSGIRHKRWMPGFYYGQCHHPARFSFGNWRAISSCRRAFIFIKMGKYGGLWPGTLLIGAR